MSNQTFIPAWGFSGLQDLSLHWGLRAQELHAGYIRLSEYGKGMKIWSSVLLNCFSTASPQAN